ncbi:1138_t:CDS:10, partial [Acaulospora morrowiae]
VRAYTTKVYDDPDKLLFISSISDVKYGFTYLDGTGLMQLIRQDGNNTDNNLYRAYPLNNGYVLVTLASANKSVVGTLVDWSGRVLQSNVMLTDVPVDGGSPPLAKTNVNADKDFLVATRNKNVILWKIFSAPNSTGKTTQLYEGSITGDDYNILVDHEIFSTTEGGYGIALLKHIPKFTDDPRNSKVFYAYPQWLLYVTFWQPGAQQFDTPRLVWQNPNPIPNNRFVINGCAVAVDGTGYFCIVKIPSEDAYDNVKVSFLSTGSVTNVNVIVNGTANGTTVKEIFGIRQMPYGGFLVVEVDVGAYTGSPYSVSVRNNDGSIIQTFKLPDAGVGDFAVFPNNTMWTGSRGSSNTSVAFVPLPKLLQEDAGFKNLLVDSSVPPSGSFVSSDTTNITLIFRKQVALSTQNISIYQETDSDPIFRQGFSAESGFCSVTLNETAVTCKIFKSTFNQPDATYDVVVDNNFVMLKSLNQPLTGVTKGNWVYHGDTTTGLLRLTPEGTSLFEQLSTDDRNSFLDSMVTKLTELVPINPSRITTNRRNQPDPNAPTHQTLFPVTLGATDDKSQRTVQQIIDDLDELIKNKGYNSFSREYPTSYLDETYVFSPSVNLWDAYKFQLLAFFVGLWVLAIIYFLARRKYPEGQNFMIVKLTIILVDLSLDIAFVLLSAKNVPQIYTPRYYHVVYDYCDLAFSILMKEISKNVKFQEWFSKNVRVASVSTLLAGADVEVITLIGSKFAGLKMFSAPLSKIALNQVFWVSTLNLVIEDIPQLIIQILYRDLTVSYDIIPLLSLVMSSIVLTSNIVGRVYDGCIRWKERKRRHSIPKDEMLVTSDVQEDE